MHVQLALLLCLSLPAWGNADDAQIKEVFAKYEQILTKNKTELVSEVFSEKYIADRGGEKQFKSELTPLKVPAYELDIKPGQLDKDIKTVKMIPKGHKGHVENIFLMKRRPSGEWRIEGTFANED